LAASVLRIKAPSFRQAFKKRRCLIPADGFYEWRKTQTPKLPFAIAMKDGRPFTFAPALGETGKIPDLENGCALARLSQANQIQLVAQIHPRMPVILPLATSRGLVRRNRQREPESVVAPLPCRPDAHVGNFSAGKQPEE
jgi:putative SOS response-associated peptidase YedK